MIKKTLNKHVVIRIDGIDLIGFVLSTDDDYIELAERDNDITIIKIQDISFIKVMGSKVEIPKQEKVEVIKKVKNNIEEEKKANPQQLAAVVSKKRDNDFSVVDHGLNGGGYQTPSFSRQTERK